MRVVFALLAGVLLLAACGANKPKTVSTAATATASAMAMDTKLIAVHPCELPLPAAEMIPGKFEMRENSPSSPGLATAQCSRSWDRDAAEATTGNATRVAINARLYQTLTDGKADFDNNFAGDAGKQSITNIIENRAILRHQITVEAVPNPPSFGTDQQSVYRAQYTRGNAVETWVDYYVFLRVKNTFAYMQVSAQNISGAEAKGLAADMQTLAKKQADRLLSFPATADPVTPTRVPTGALILPISPGTATPTPRP